MPDQIVDPAPGPDSDIEGIERADVLRAAIRELDAHYREALVLVYVEGLKVEEAARALGVPEGTVKTRLMRGRLALKKILLRRHPEHFGD
jgi:RNA polymerase sigma-70 factor (ECF subfamily)